MIDFGYCLPIFSGSQDKMARTPMINSLTDLNAKTVSKAEQLGFNSLWVADHLSMNGDNAILEGWTTLSWAAGITKNIMLGNIHFNNIIRQPHYTAKIITTLDTLTRGRMNLFFDGGHPGTINEVSTYGFNFLSNLERIEMLEEAIEMINLLWKEPKKSFNGKYYSVKEIYFNPPPYNSRKIPIWIGTLTPSSQTKDWNSRLSRTVAKYADWWNLTPIGIDSYKKTIEEMKIIFNQEKRDFATVKKSVELEILIAENDKDLNSLKDKIKMNNAEQKFFGDWENWSKTNLYGTPDEIYEKLLKYIDLGVENFMLWFIDSPSTNGIEIFSKEIISKYK